MKKCNNKKKFTFFIHTLKLCTKNYNKNAWIHEKWSKNVQILLSSCLPDNSNHRTERTKTTTTLLSQKRNHLRMRDVLKFALRKLKIKWVRTHLQVWLLQQQEALEEQKPLRVRVNRSTRVTTLTSVFLIMSFIRLVLIFSILNWACKNYSKV